MSDFRARVQRASAEGYFDAEYATPERFWSWGVQVREALATGARRVLEVGSGPGVVAHVLAGAGLRVWTVDLDPGTAPDVVGELSRIPLADGAVETVLCCQVLEHLPWEAVPAAVAELRRVASAAAVVSVPDVRPFYYVDAALPKLRVRRRWGVPWHRPESATFDGEHYWSVGVREVPLARFRATLEGAGWRIVRSERPLEHAYHHFFTLE